MQAPFPITPGLRDALMERTSAMSAASGAPAMSAASCRSASAAGRTAIVEQIRRAREEIGAGVLDLSLQPIPAPATPMR